MLNYEYLTRIIQNLKLLKMFKNIFQVAVVFSVIALIMKLVIFSMGIQHGSMEEYVRYAYMFLVLTTVFFGMRINRINNPDIKPTFIQDFKAGVRAAAFFAI